jgi:hypothetical protein
MNWFIVLGIHILNIQGNNFNIRRVSLLKGDFWCHNQEKVEIFNKKHLSKILFDIEDESGNGKYDGLKFDLSNMKFLKFTENRYAKLSGKVSKDISLSLNSAEDVKTFLKLDFYFAREPIEFYKYYNEHEEIIEICKTYMLPELHTERNDIMLNYERIKTRMHHIKNIFWRLLHLKSILFDGFFFVVNGKKEQEWINDDKIFNLYHFNNYTDCLKSLTKYVKNLKNLIFMVADKVDLINEKFSLEIAQPCNENEECVRNFLPVETEFTKATKLLHKKTCYYLKNKILENSNFFIFSGKQDIGSYLDDLCKFVLELVKTRNIDFYCGNLDKKKNIFQDLTVLIDSHIKKLQDTNEKEFCEFETFYNYFSYLLRKKVETFNDYISVEKILIDYTNMFTYITNLIRIIDEPSSHIFEYLTPSPIFTENYNYRIIDGIEIKSLNKIKIAQIKALDYDDNVHILNDGVEYFSNKFKKIYLPSDVLKMKNIREIELISSDNLLGKRFEIKEYLT